MTLLMSVANSIQEPLKGMIRAEYNLSIIHIYLVTEVLDSVKGFGCFCHTTNLDYVADDVAK